MGEKLDTRAVLDFSKWITGGGVERDEIMDVNKIYCGDSLEICKTLPDESIDCCITSPPYWGLRDYGISGQLGLEKTPEEYVAKMVEIFKEVRRVLKNNGTLWLNLGDSYNGSGGDHKEGKKNDAGFQGEYSVSCGGKGRNIKTLKPKDLVGIPWRVAFALQANGWYLRQDIIWHKPNPMPESVTDRCTKAHEYIFLLSKSQKYYFDNKAISQPAKQNSIARLQRAVSNENKWINGPDGQTKHTMNQPRENYKHLKGKAPERFGGSDHLVAAWEGNVNKRSVWTVSTKPFRGAHFATFPEDLIFPCILAGCPKGGIVLDPFFGAGTTGLTAKKNGKNYIGIELNPEYAKIAEERIRGVLL